MTPSPEHPGDRLPAGPTTHARELAAVAYEVREAARKLQERVERVIETARQAAAVAWRCDRPPGAAADLAPAPDPGASTAASRLRQAITQFEATLAESKRRLGDAPA